MPTDLTWLAGALPAGELAALEERQTDADAQQPFAIQARNFDRLDDTGMTTPVTRPERGQ